MSFWKGVRVSGAATLASTCVAKRRRKTVRKGCVLRVPMKRRPARESDMATVVLREYWPDRAGLGAARGSKGGSGGLAVGRG